MISIVGAFLLIADYIVTAAISAFFGFHVFRGWRIRGVAAVAILGIGALNYFGPKHTGGLAFLVAAPTAVVVLLLAIFALPHLGVAYHNLEPAAWRVGGELEGVCGGGAGAFGGGGDRQFDGGDEN